MSYRLTGRIDMPMNGLIMAPAIGPPGLRFSSRDGRKDRRGVQKPRFEDPIFCLTGALDLLDPTFRCLDSGQPLSDTLDLDIWRRGAFGTRAQVCIYLGFGPTRHGRHADRRGSSGRCDLGG